MFVFLNVISALEGTLKDLYLQQGSAEPEMVDAMDY